MRIESDRGDPAVFRLGDVFPVVRILNDRGAMVAKPAHRPPSVRDVEEAVLAGGAADKVYRRELAKAEAIMKLPASLPAEDQIAAITSARLARVKILTRTIVERADGEGALALYEGFAKEDSSDERWESLQKLASFLTSYGNFEVSEKVLDEAEPVFGEAKKLELSKLHASNYGMRIRKAVNERNRWLAYKILDELCARYPDGAEARDKEAARKRIDAMWPRENDEGWNSLRNND